MRIPYLWMTYVMGMDLNEDQIFKPNVYFTHDFYQKIPKGCKYIYILRNPYDVLISYLHYYPHNFCVTDIPVQYLAENCFSRR